MADSSCCFCFHFSLTCTLPPGFVFKKMQRSSECSVTVSLCPSTFSS